MTKAEIWQPMVDEAGNTVTLVFDSLAEWLRHDLEILEQHHGVSLEYGVGKSLNNLADQLDR